MGRVLCAGLFMAAICAAMGVRAEDPKGARIALVIGNATYAHAPLANPVNDARAVAGALRESGFHVMERHNASAVEMRRAIREFGELLAGKDAGVFYYAGHGVQVSGRNFLVPVSADIRYEDEIEDQSVDVSLVLAKMGGARSRTNLLILDACRNNPFARSTRSAAMGLAPMEAPIGTLVAFATSPGQVASDGTGANGLYTQFLVREMRQAGLKVEDVFKRVRAAVRQASAGRQIPWENTSLEGDFYFRAPVVVDATAVERASRARQEDEIQRKVEEAVTRSQLEAQDERRKLEAFYARRIEEERAAMQKEAAERIAAIEKMVAVAAAPRPAVDMAAAPGANPPRPAQKTPSEGDPEELQNLILLSMALPTTLPKVSEPVERGLQAPGLKVGDSWTYHREIREGARRRHYVTHEVHSVDANETVIGTNEGFPVVLDGAGDVVSAPSANQSLRNEPPDPRYRFPLEPGKRWTSSGTQRSANAQAKVDSTVTVIGWEDVSVPAGSFLGLKVVRVTERALEAFPGQAASSKIAETHWYVPSLKGDARREILEVASTGRVERDETWELDSFRLY